MHVTFHRILWVPLSSLLAFAFAWMLAEFVPNDSSLSGVEREGVVVRDTASLRAKGALLFPHAKWDEAKGGGFLGRAGLGSSARRIGWLPSSAVPELSQFGVGMSVMLPLDQGVSLPARVERIALAQGVRVISGRLREGASGSFVLRDGGAEGLSGHLLAKHLNLACQFREEGARVMLTTMPLGEVVCEGMPLEPNHIRPRPRTSVGKSGLVIPLLDSRPSAKAVLYLDFDGEVVTDPNWRGGNTIFALPAVMAGLPITEEQIRDVWERVAEDFRPFHVAVTTNRARYESAAPGNRMRCIQTPTTDAAPYAGGVAYVRSFRGRWADPTFRDDIPCWSFNSQNAAIMAMTISHELGHTLGLHHDGQLETGYYPGHGPPGFRWGAIMGAAFDATITQWSRGEYPGANNQEDDLLIAAGVLEQANGPGTGFRKDDVGNSTATALDLAKDGIVSVAGVIHSAKDKDVYRFRTAGGPVSFTAELSGEPNLDPRLSIQDESGAQVASAPVVPDALGATLTTDLSVGVYYLVVSAGERASTPDNPGFSAYGSLGAYRLAGSYVPLPTAPLFVEHPEPAVTIREGASFTLSGKVISHSKVSYRWRKDGKLLAGSTGRTLTLGKVRFDHAGLYVLEAVNASGLAQSQAAVVTVEYKPVFSQQPTASVQAPEAGGSTVLSVVAHGTGALSYQWRKDGVAIQNHPAASTSSLTLNDLEWSDGGSYTCVCSNEFGSTTSAVFRLVVASPPRPVTHVPQTITVAKGSTFTLTSSFVGSSGMTYQWFKGAMPLVGATKPTLKLAGASEFVHEGVPYFVRATNRMGSSDGPPISVDVQDAPSVSAVGPLAINSTAGASVTLTVAASGTNPLTYQWFHNALLLPGQTSAQLTLDPLHWSHRGMYHCVVSNAVGSAKSPDFSVDLISPAVILSPPLSTKLPTGGRGVVKVVAGGSPALKYQWYKDEVLIPGATRSSLVLAGASQLTAGRYHVEVWNLLDLMPVVSPVAIVEVENAPKIALHPFTTYAPRGGTATLVVMATDESAPVLRYQWFKQGKPLPGQTGSSLILSALSNKDAGDYHAVVTNDVGRAASRKARLHVVEGPRVLSHPDSAVQHVHGDVILRVKAAGHPPLRYSWHFKGGPPIPGANGAALILRNVGFAQAGSYHCAVSNAAGVAYSLPALLEVIPYSPPEVLSFEPRQTAAGQRVRVLGHHLDQAVTVLLNSKACSFVKVSAGELLLTVPVGAAADPITVVTPGGQASSEFSLLVTKAMPNDDFANSQILIGKSWMVRGNNAGATTQPDEPQFWDGATVWFRWKCPATGFYTLDSSGTLFGHIVQVFEGAELNALMMRTFTSRYLGYDYSNGAMRGPHQWHAKAQQEYFFRVDGVSEYWYVPGTGDISISVKPSGLSLSELAEGNSQLGGGTSQVFSASGFPSFEIPALEGASSRGIFKATFDTEGCQSTFQWSLVDGSGIEMLALKFSAETKSITVIDQMGQELPTGQVYLGVGSYDLELGLDEGNGSWSASLNGHVLMTGEFTNWENAANSTAPRNIQLRPTKAGPGAIPAILSSQWLGDQSVMRNADTLTRSVLHGSLSEMVPHQYRGERSENPYAGQESD